MKIILYITLLLFLISCGSDQTTISEGTGSETVNTFTGVVHYADGNSAADVSVWLIDENIESVKDESWLLDSSVTDSEGEFSLSTTVQGTFRVQVSGNDVVDYRDGVENSVTSLGDFVLDKGHVVTGIVKGGGSEILVVGTSCRAAIQSDGSFVITNVPNGTFSLSTDGAYSSGFKTTKDTIDMGTIVVQDQFILLDDFQHANSMSLLGWLLPKSEWDIALSNVVINPIAIEGSFGNIISFTDSWEGRSVYFTLNSKTPEDTATLDLRHSIGQLWQYWDINAMNALSFMSKGSGLVRVYLEIESSDFVTDVKDIGWDITLGENWSEVKLNVSDLTNSGQAMSTSDIEKALKSVTSLGFKMETTGNDTLLFQADNFTMLGISAFDLVKK